MAVRVKFVVQSIERQLSYGNGKEVHTIKMAPVYSQDPESENRKFWEATPSGSLLLGVVNAEAVEQFELGKSYYLDFTPAGEEKNAK
jgi:hypothetical protein